MDCVVFGAGTDFLAEVLSVLRRLEWSPVGFVAGGEDGVTCPPGVDPVESDSVPADWLSLPVVVPVITPWRRRKLVEEARRIGFSTFPATVDPSAVVAHGGTIGEGAFVNAGVVIGASTRVGPFAVVNRAVSIGHDGRIGEYSLLAPAANLTGQVTIGEGSVIGSGAIVTSGRTVGSNSMVGVGSVVFKDVPDRTLVLGNPARLVRSGLEDTDVAV